jgi:stage V sporulation protein B
VNDVRVTAEAQTRAAGRGVLSITGAKLWFIVAGYAVQLLLPRLLATPEAFGLYSSGMNVVSILNNVLVAATVQSVSKHVSEAPGEAAATLRQGLILQLCVGGLLSLGLWLLSPWLATEVLNDPLVEPLIAVSSVVVFCYAVYAALIGSLNGQQRFSRQAGLDSTYTLLRTVLILGGAKVGVDVSRNLPHGVFGAMLGFAAAAAAVLVVALFVVGTGAPGGKIAWKRWLAFLAPLWLYQLCLSLTLQMDLSVLKSVAATLAQQAGMLPEAAALQASRLVGLYRAAQTFAFVPYQLILSVAFVVFPMVSQAVTLQDHAAARRYIGGALRFSLIVLLAIAAPVSGAAAGVMRIAYKDVYLGGSGALAVLAIGTVGFALFAIGSTIMSGAGQPRVPAIIALVTVGLVLVCDVAFLHIVGIGPNTLVAAAAGTTVGMTVAMVAIAVAIHMRFGVFIAPLSALRIVASGAVGWAVARVMPSHTALFSLLALCAGGAAFVVALIATRELGAADFDVVRKIARRR